MTSVARRWVSGSLAAWARVAINVVLQIAAVPVFLSHWSPAELGVWLVITSLTPYLNAVDLGHQNFMAFEFLRISDDAEVARLFVSSLAAGAVIGLLATLAAIGLALSGALGALIGSHDPTLVQQAGLIIVVQAVVWMLFGSMGGLLGRVVVRFGHYPRTAWWGVAYVVVTGVAPLIAVSLGGDLLTAGLSLSAAIVAVNIPLLLDYRRLWLAQGAARNRPDPAMAFRNAVKSLGLTAQDLLLQVRQQGVRLVLAPLVGVTQMTAFATHRTGANVALQGLTTITGPFEPEFLRFLRSRDQERVDTALSVGWIIVTGAVAPALMAAQFVMPPVFEAWTRGKIEFDHLLFALLSCGVAVFAYAQTATTVVRGNNLIRIQIWVSGTTAAVTLLGLVLTAPAYGLRGAAATLLLAEILACVIYQIVAARWMHSAGLRWPSALARIGAIACMNCGVVLILAGAAPDLSLWILAVGLAVHMAICFAFYRALPRLAHERLGDIAGRAGALLRRRPA